MNKTIGRKAKLWETITYYFYMLMLIVLFFLIVGILSVVNAQNNATDLETTGFYLTKIQEGKKHMRTTYGRGTEITQWIKEHRKYAPYNLNVFNYSIAKFEANLK